MSSLPPYENNNPYIPPTQYTPSGEPVSNPYGTPPPPAYPTTDPYAQPSSYPVPEPYAQPPAYAQPTPVFVAQPQYVAVPMQINDPGSGQALAGMILGIAGLFLSFFGLVPLLGLIFSIIGMRSVTRKGMAIAGLVMSIIGLLAAVFFTILIIAAIIAAANTPTY